MQADWGTAQPTAALKILTPVNNILLTVAPSPARPTRAPLAMGWLQ